MENILPRGSTRIVMAAIRITRSFCSSSSAHPFFTHLFHPLQAITSQHHREFRRFSAMEKQFQDTKDDDQHREVYCKGASDLPQSKHASDHIIPHILNLYASRATPEDFEIYAPDATFEDPLMCAHGVKQIKSAFYSIGKVFSESRIVDYSIQENVISPGKKEILIDNKQYYKFLGRNINMISLIKLYLEDGKIIRHEDWWDKKPLMNRETIKLPLAGRIIEASRRASMFATHALMGFGKDPTM